jgi:hypothetical protein
MAFCIGERVEMTLSPYRDCRRRFSRPVRQIKARIRSPFELCRILAYEFSFVDALRTQIGD